MKRISILSALLAGLVFASVLPGTTPILSAFAQNVAVYIEQGGAKQVVATGGELEMQSGATLDIQAGTTVTNAATTTMSGAVTFSASGGITLANGESLNTGSDDVFDFTRDDAGTVTITASDNDATAALTVLPGGAAAMTIGGASTTAITLTTDGTGTGEVVLPTGAISTGEIADGTLLAADSNFPGRDWFNICGEATTINNNTIYYGPSVVLLPSSGNGQTCDINNAGNATEATDDAPIYTNQAVHVLGMTCRNEQDANANISFTLRTAEGATVPSVTCTIADGERDCVADVQTTTTIAAGATVAIAAASSSDVGDGNGFLCNVAVAY